MPHSLEKMYHLSDRIPKGSMYIVLLPAVTLWIYNRAGTGHRIGEVTSHQVLYKTYPPCCNLAHAIPPQRTNSLVFLWDFGEWNGKIKKVVPPIDDVTEKAAAARWWTGKCSCCNVAENANRQLFSCVFAVFFSFGAYTHKGTLRQTLTPRLHVKFSRGGIYVHTLGSVLSKKNPKWILCLAWYEPTLVHWNTNHGDLQAIHSFPTVSQLSANQCINFLQRT